MEIVDFIAEVKLSQCYHNIENLPIEVTYHFPVDEAAAICGFEAEYEDGSVVKGVVREKNQAREEYQLARRSGKQANLLKSVRRDIFTLNAGNLPAKSHVKITITYVTTPQSREDAAALVLPTCIAPRYVPGNAGSSTIRNEELDAMSPPVSTVKLYGLNLQAKISCRSSITKITTPTHSTEPSLVYYHAGKTGHFELKDMTMDRDLVILVEENEPHQPRASIEVSNGGTMTGLVTIFPQIEFPDKQREFIFVIDRSGSMDGQKIKQAREALLLFLRSLPASCTFNIVSFGSTFRSLYPNPVSYNDESLEFASTSVKKMYADMGGTQVYNALRDVFNRPSSERQIFVLTDGQVSNDKQVFNLIRENCSPRSSSKGGRCRLFSVGIGNNVSRHLVQGMARAGRGTARFVEEGSVETLRVKVLGQLKQALQPSYDDVSIEWQFAEDQKETVTSAMDLTPKKTLLGYRSPSIDENPSISASHQPKIYPSTSPPIFSRERFLSYAMFPSGSPIPESVKITCNSDDGPLDVVLKISDEETFEGSIARKLAARVAITEYEDQRKVQGTGYMLPHGTVLSAKDALQLALTNSLVSENTSFIAIQECATPGRTHSSNKTTIPQVMHDEQSSPAGSTPARLMTKSFALRSPPDGIWGGAQEKSNTPSSSHRDSAAYDIATFGMAQRKNCKKSKPRKSREFDSKAAVVDNDSLRRSCRRSRRSSGATTDRKYADLATTGSAQSSKKAAIPQRMLGLYSTAEVCRAMPGLNSSSAEVHREDSQRCCRRSRSSSGTTTDRKSAAVQSGTDYDASAYDLTPACDTVATSQSKKYMTSKARKSRDVDSKAAVVGNDWHQDTILKSGERYDTFSSLVTSKMEATSDLVLQFCLLQKADGSFIHDTKFEQVTRITKNTVETIGSKIRNDSIVKEEKDDILSLLLNPTILTTFVAISVMQAQFDKQRNVWELQEKKSLNYLLVTTGLSEKKIQHILSIVVMEIRNI